MTSNTFLKFLIFTGLMFFSGISCKEKSNQPMDVIEAEDSTVTESQVDRGKYLVQIMGCNDCHSPKRMGPKGPEIIPELMLSGYPSERPLVDFKSPLLQEGFGMFYPDLTGAAGPWGISFAANLTPDETGIGNWTEEQFKIALTQGKSKGLENGRPLLPPMPWFNYTNMKDEDVSAIYAYLKSIDPVSNTVPAPVPPAASK
jgi:hypothetical protein